MYQSDDRAATTNNMATTDDILHVWTVGWLGNGSVTPAATKYIYVAMTNFPMTSHETIWVPLNALWSCYVTYLVQVVKL